MKIYIGVVEDINDPAEMNRLRVRIYSKHNQNKEELPTSALSWSNVLLPFQTTSLNISQGSWVAGSYVDEAEQEFLVMGMLSSRSTPITSDINIGFNDPEKAYPKNHQVDTPSTATSDYRNTEPYQMKKATEFDNVPIATTVNGSISTWSTPDVTDTNRPSYPFNHVSETKGGHVLEFDDTHGYERISEFHKSGTYREIQANGDQINVVKGKNYRIVVSDEDVYIQGSCNLTIDGNLNTLVKGNYTLEVEGDVTENIKGNKTTHTNENFNQDIRGDITQNVQGSILNTTDGNLTDTVTGRITATSVAGIGMTSLAGTTLTSTSTIAYTAPLITQTGNVIAVGDITAGTVSLKNHTHGGVDSGSSSTSIPNQ